MENIFQKETEFHASCSEGLSDFLCEEAIEKGVSVISSNRGGLFFTGDKETVQNFILESSIASSISYKIQSWEVSDYDDFYKKANRFAFEKILSDYSSFKIDSSTKDTLNHSHFSLLRLKDAIFDRYRSLGKEIPQIDKENPDILFFLRSTKNKVHLFVSFSTNPLNKRGHKRKGGEAPIKETIAAALLNFSKWKKEEVVWDPFCGSGTILIESALRILYKNKINFQNLKNSKVFNKIFQINWNEFQENKFSKTLFGYDHDEEIVETAIENAKNAGVSEIIQFEKKGIFESLKLQTIHPLKIITNPPYGVRLGNKEEVKKLYTEFGKLLKSNFYDATLNLVCGDPSLLGYLKLKKDIDKSLTIGKLRGKFVQYSIIKNR